MEKKLWAGVNKVEYLVYLLLFVVLGFFNQGLIYSVNSLAFHLSFLFLLILCQMFKWAAAVFQ